MPSQRVHLAPANTASFVVRPLLMLYRCIPITAGSLVFGALADEIEVCWDSCCCACLPVRLDARTVPRVRKQPLWSVARLIRDLPISFVIAFLFHLVPSNAWGAEVSLGSPQHHQMMGIVWFGGWPVFFILLQLLRPWGLHLPATPAGCGCTGTFIPFASPTHARAVAEWWAAAVAKNRTVNASLPPLPRARLTACDATNIVAGLLVAAALVVNALVTAAAVNDCMSRGCCFDNATSLESCRATGFPS